MRRTSDAAAATLLGLAGLILGAVPAGADDPYVRPDPTLTVDCRQINLYAVGVDANENRARIAATAVDPEAPAPYPAQDYTFGVDITLEYNFLNPAWSYAWTADVWTMDGQHWSRAGTTTACQGPGYVKGYVTPVVPSTVTACGATLDDVGFATTRHVSYWHDDKNAYATAEDGWGWTESSVGPPHHGWMPPDNVPSNQASTLHIEGYVLLKPPTGCRHTVPGPYDPQPTEPVSQAGAGWARPTASSPTTTASPTAQPTLQPATPAATPTRSPDPTPRTTQPSPSSTEPTPSPTAGAQASPRTAAGTGLAVAGGLAGACALTAAGAFVVRKRLRFRPVEVLLDESEPERAPDEPDGTD